MQLAFYGEEAQRIQRARAGIRVMVCYFYDERQSLGDLGDLRILTPDGGQVPFSPVAQVESGRGRDSIQRVDRNLAVRVTAAVDLRRRRSFASLSSVAGRGLRASHRSRLRTPA